MPEMSKAFVPKHFGDKNPNPKLIKLLRHITDRIPGKIKMTTESPEYWGMACIFEDEMDKATSNAAIDLMLDMLPRDPFKVRKRWTRAQLHELNGKKHYMPDAEAFDDLLDRMSFLGIMEYDYGDKYTKDGPVPGTTYNREDRVYWVPMFVPGHRPDGPPSGTGNVLRAHDLPAAGEDHPHGPYGRFRHRNARHPCGEGHQHGERIHRHRAYLILAQAL